VNSGNPVISKSVGHRISAPTLIPIQIRQRRPGSNLTPRSRPVHVVIVDPLFTAAREPHGRSVSGRAWRTDLTERGAG
jgi:hypothetical protein